LGGEFGKLVRDFPKLPVLRFCRLHQQFDASFECHFLFSIPAQAATIEAALRVAWLAAFAHLRFLRTFGGEKRRQKC
jgi:hypothetical protein